MYGLPDSMVVGTARRVGRRMGKRRVRDNTIGNLNWIWGWVVLGALWFIAYFVQGIINLFS